MARKTKLMLRDFPTNTENPFLRDSVNEIEKHIVKKWRNASSTDKRAVLVATNPETGEILGHTTFMRQVDVDEEQFTKLFLAQFEAFFDLTKAGIRVFGYVMKCLRPRIDMIYFDKDECMQYTQYTSLDSIYRGITELIKAGILARSKSDSMYYINPLIVWNGDRVTFVHDYRKKKPKTEDDNQLSLFEEMNAEIEAKQIEN